MILMSVRYEGAVPGVTLKRALMNKVKQKGYNAAGVEWHQKFMPEHFTESGGRKYGYKQRSKSYRARKLRVKHHRRPLVWSGLSQALMRIRDVRAKTNGVKIYSHASGLNRRRSSRAPDMLLEMGTVTEGERQHLMAVQDRRIEKELKKVRTQSRGR